MNSSTLKLVALIPLSSEPEGPLEKNAFLHAVDDVNENSGILTDTGIVSVVYDTAGDIWTGFESAVEGLSRGAVAVVGPGLSTVAAFISPLATHTQIPFVTPSATSLSLAFRDVHDFLIQLSPTDRLLSEATVDLLVHFGWQHIGVVLSSDQDERSNVWDINNLASLTGLKIIHIAEIPPLLPHENTQATIDTVADLMKQLKYFHAKIIVVNVPDQSLYVVFKAAARLGMIGPDYLWILSSTEFPISVLDPELIELMEGSLGLSTALPERVQDWRVAHNLNFSVTAISGVYQLYTYDCVWLIARAIDNFLRDGHSLETELLSGDEKGLPSLRRLTEGHLLVEYILNTSFDGVGGRIRFNSQTAERYGSLNIINMVNGTYHLVGRWNSHGETIRDRISAGQGYTPIRWPSGTTVVPSDRVLRLNQTIDIMVMVAEPYVFFDPSKEGNSRFSGYFIGVLEHLKEGVGFSYRLEKWNGTYNDLVKYIGDFDNPYTMGLADTVPTTDRWNLVDFTSSFHFSTITVLLNAPAVSSVSGWWGFLEPFGTGLWLMLLALPFGSAVLVCGIEKLENKRRQKNINLEKCEDINPGHYLWITSQLLFGICNVDDKKLHSWITRYWLLSVLFSLVIITSVFTAVLTTFLLSKEIRLPVTGVHQLLTERVGTTRSSNHLEYLRNIEGFRYVSEISLEEAASAVSSGRIKAFVGSRLSLQYIADVNGDCSIYVPNTNFDLRRERLSFPIQKGSSLLEPINRRIQEMWDTSALAQLNYRHFDWSSHCDKVHRIEGVDTIELEEIAGIFLVVVVAAFISIAGKFVRKWCTNWYNRFARSLFPF
jgi:ionotropic glutamate receptor